MAKIYKGDLNGSLVNSSINALQDEYKSADNMINSINTLISSTKTTQQGPAYDAARNKISSYINTLNTQKNITNDLIVAIRQATQTMTSYMEDYSFLDDSKIPEIEEQMNNIKNSIAQLESELSSLSGFRVVSRNVISARISQLKEKLSKLERLYNKLVGLAGADAGAFGAISGLGSNISNFSSDIASQQVGNVE